MPYPAIPEHYELGKKFGVLLSTLLREKRLKTTPLKLVPNGLADVQQWIQYQKDKKVGYALIWVLTTQKLIKNGFQVSAEKITYRISDTP